VHIESLTLMNFRCFGPEPVTIELDAVLTVMVGANGTGKSATFEALARLFGVTAEQRRIRPDDFHVPIDEEDVPATRELSIDVVMAFPELGNDDEDETDDSNAVPEFFRQMAADERGELKCRFRLEATWTDDACVDGTVTEEVRVVHTLDSEYAEDEWSPLRPLDRARIQMIYVPAARDGARHVTAFLRGRLWRAAQWSDELKAVVDEASDTLTDQFRSEAVVRTVERALARRWQDLHQAVTDANPIFRPVDRDFAQIVSKAQLVFEPTETGRERLADQLSDGQRSLLHIALAAATLDVEAMITSGAKEDEFDVEQARVPSLTLLVVEEPENGLSPYFLSRIVLQTLEVADGLHAQALVSSHSASVLGRVDPGVVRHFQLDAESRRTIVNALVLPDDGDERATYVREAVRAFPELYFARFVVLGEGSSEEVVIPLLADAAGVVVDRSFVAVVPLGGRHVNHFWRLLSGLRIPYATLIDLDSGRHAGGEGRIRTICRELVHLGVDPLAGVDGFDDPADIRDLTEDEVETLLSELREHDVFFSEPLDLDMTLFTAFPAEYKALARLPGPQNTDAFDAVLGPEGQRSLYEGWDDEMRWYRYLFLGRSKPSTHLRALTSIDAEALAENTPEPLVALIARISEAVD
jgi:putative ATP-dependent endonuclease of OLD family